MRPIRGRDAKAGTASPTQGQLCRGARVRLPCPDQSWPPRALSLCSSHLSRCPRLLGGHGGVSLGWGQHQPPSAQCTPAVCWGLCVTSACPPSLTEMTSDSLSHTPVQSQAHQASAPASLPGPAAPGARLERAGQERKQPSIPSSLRLLAQPLQRPGTQAARQVEKLDLTLIETWVRIQPH